MYPPRALPPRYSLLRIQSQWNLSPNITWVLGSMENVPSSLWISKKFFGYGIWYFPLAYLGFRTLFWFRFFFCFKSNAPVELQTVSLWASLGSLSSKELECTSVYNIQIISETLILRKTFHFRSLKEFSFLVLLLLCASAYIYLNTEWKFLYQKCISVNAFPVVCQSNLIESICCVLFGSQL